jgi:quinol monooxygenase YgiN
VIFIVVKFRVDEMHRDRWPSRTEAFTDATRAEPGNLWFEWSQSFDDPNEYVLVEAFQDAEAGAAHVNSDHFRQGLAAMRTALIQTPKIINAEISGRGVVPDGRTRDCPRIATQTIGRALRPSPTTPGSRWTLTSMYWA